jgi:16S rRNA pseudouridine516 synthase
MKMRLDRWLVTIGTGSRSEVKAWIRGGEAAVNGRTIRDSALSFDPEKDQLTLRGIPLDGRVIRHVMMNKPAGVLTAARDPKQPTVMDLLPEVYRRIGCMPVGRLDKDTTGILIFTCDGEMNHRLLSPSRHVKKRYRALAEGPMGAADVDAFARGMDLGDFVAQGAKLEILCSGEPSLAEVTIMEGKFHQVKRMFAAVGHEVIQLHRCTFGPLKLDENLPEGSWRELTEEELRALRLAAGMETR